MESAKDRCTSFAKFRCRLHWQEKKVASVSRMDAHKHNDTHLSV